MKIRDFFNSGERIEGTNFRFNSVPVEELATRASDFTLVTIVIDHSGSMQGNEQDMMDMLKACIEAALDNPRAENVLLRVTLFSEKFGIKEVHGFLPLSELPKYKAFKPDDGTPLWDATYDAIGAMGAYGKRLTENAFTVNGICFVITDGRENASEKASPSMISNKIADIEMEEHLESLVSIVIGMDNTNVSDFAYSSGLTHHKTVGEITPELLAGLAQFMSSSISTQSKATGTGEAGDIEDDLEAFF